MLPPPHRLQPMEKTCRDSDNSVSNLIIAEGRSRLNRGVRCISFFIFVKQRHERHQSVSACFSAQYLALWRPPRCGRTYPSYYRAHCSCTRRQGRPEPRADLVDPPGPCFGNPVPVPPAEHGSIAQALCRVSYSVAPPCDKINIIHAYSSSSDRGST